MRILFYNELETATITSLEESTNYPAENLIHPFLEKRYQPYLETTDTLTFTFTANRSINCLFLGYHTLTSYTARFYDGTDTLLLTVTNAAPSDVEYRSFAALTTVRKIEIDVAFPGTGSPYIGGIGAGLGFDLPYFLSGYDLPVKDNSGYSESTGGQTLQVKRAILKEYEFTVPDQALAIKDAFMAGFYAAGKGKALFVAVFNAGVTMIRPLYCKFLDNPKIKKNGRMYDISFELREAR
jgi:hypothetical protein